MSALVRPAGHVVATASADGAVLPPRLSGTGLFPAGSPEAIASSHRRFVPQYPLWTDGAEKRRWILLPAGTAIDGRDDRRWEFPVGTRLWKEFRFGGRPVETRFLWKASAAGWVAGTYVWTEDGADATLAPEDGVPEAAPLDGGRAHRIPSRGDCATCHGPTLSPLGFNALQLSDDRDPNAIHGEPAVAGMVTLASLVADGALTGTREGLQTAPPRIRASHPQTRSLLGYLAANCGACHNDAADMSAQVPSLAFADVMEDGDAIAARLVGRPTRWQAPGRTDGTVLLDAAAPDASAMLARMRSRRPSSQMPPLGSAIPDHEAITALERWLAEVAPSTVAAAHRN